MISIVEKIRSRLIVSEEGCWLWQGAKVRKGYGVVLIPMAGRLTYTHRAMYEALRGPIGAGLQIDHLCRNPACCNPDHLEAVTPAENTRRGLSPELARARGGQKTLCPHGHELVESNIYRDKKGHRSCRKCRQRRHVEWDEKRRSYRAVTAKDEKVVSIASAKSAVFSEG